MHRESSREGVCYGNIILFDRLKPKLKSKRKSKVGGETMFSLPSMVGISMYLQLLCKTFFTRLRTPKSRLGGSRLQHRKLTNHDTNETYTKTIEASVLTQACVELNNDACAITHVVSCHFALDNNDIFLPSQAVICC